MNHNAAPFPLCLKLYDKINIFLDKKRHYKCLYCRISVFLPIFFEIPCLNYFIVISKIVHLEYKLEMYQYNSKSTHTLMTTLR